MFERITKCVGAIAAGVLATMVLASQAVAEPQFQFVDHSFAAPPTTSLCESVLGIACYNAQQYERAYGTDQLYRRGITGAGQTIVIVDSFGSPTIQQDLETYDQQNGLPDPPSFRIITPEGAPPAWDPNDPTMTGWGIETSLDVEISHTMAPGANILLVETPVAETEGIVGFPQMMAAEQYVIDHHMGNVISQSFAATEQTFTSPAQIYGLRYAYEDAEAHGVTVLGATGDDGSTSAETDGVDYYPFNAVNWPASDPLVTAVGGTQLNLDDYGNRIAPDDVWNDTYNPLVVGPTPSPAAGNGGLSTVFSRPSYQDSVARVVGRSRGVPDISASAAVNGGMNVYWSFANAYGAPPGFYIVGGTSEATPLTAGIVSLADQVAGHGLGLINPTLYRMGDGWGSGITDITIGNNGVTFTNTGGSDDGTFTLPGYTAGRGYDLASGLGTPDAPQFVYQLAESGFSH